MPCPEDTPDELAETAEPEEWLARLRKRKAATGDTVTVESILAARDADRR